MAKPVLFLYRRARNASPTPEIMAKMAQMWELSPVRGTSARGMLESSISISTSGSSARGTSSSSISTSGSSARGVSGSSISISGSSILESS